MLALQPQAIPEFHFSPPVAKIDGRSVGYALLAHLLLLGMLYFQLDWKKEPEKRVITVQAELWGPNTPAQGVAPTPSKEPQSEQKATPPAPTQAAKAKQAEVQAAPKLPKPVPKPLAKAPPKPEPKPSEKTAAKSVVKATPATKPAAKPSATVDASAKQKASQQAAQVAAQIAAKKAANEKAANEKAAAQALKAEQDKLKVQKQAAAENAAKAAAAKVAAEKAKADRQKALAEKMRNDEIERLKKSLGGATDKTGSPSAPSPTASGGYQAKIRDYLRPFIVYSGSVAGNPRAEVEVSVNSSGRIVSKKLIRSSGNSAWDNAVLSALGKAGSTLKDIDGRYPSPMIISFRPLD